MMDNLNLKPQSPDEVKTMMWTGENQREMFDLLTCGKKIDDYMTASGENFFIDHNAVKGGLVLIANVGNQCGCEIPVKIGDYVCGRRYGDKWCFSVADGAPWHYNSCVSKCGKTLNITEPCRAVRKDEFSWLNTNYRIKRLS